MKMVSLTDEVYNQIKERKGTLSFGNYIKGLMGEKTTKSEVELLNNKMIKLEIKVNKIEDFVRQKSGGQYE